jgi:hypothetical protein
LQLETSSILSLAAELSAVGRGAVTVPGAVRTRVNDEAIKRWIASIRDQLSEANSITAMGDQSKIDTPPDDLGIVRYPGPTRSGPREEVLQEWEGQVQDVGERVFSARLVDLTQGNTEETEETDLPIDDLVEGDKVLLVRGAVFRWIVGYRWEDGNKERFTRIVIRRLPIWTESEMKAADRRAAELHHALFGYGNRRPAGS